MSKKGYQKRLPTVIVPAPRSAPEQESGPGPDTERVPAPPPPAPPVLPSAAPDRPRAVVVGVLVVVSLLVVGALAVGVPRLLESDRPSSTPPEVPGADYGPATTEESYVEAQVAPDGTIFVRHWIRLTERLRRVSLRLPDVPDGVTLSATDVQVLADGQPTPGPAGVGAGRVTYRFAPATTVRLSYVLVGAVTVSDEETGRALALATALDVRYPHRPAVETRVVRAPAVLALACTPSVRRTPEPCGTTDGDDWRVELTGPHVDDRVLAQLTLD